MTVSTLRPNATTSNTGAITGGTGTAHGVLSDDSDASYITFDVGEEATLTLGDLALPSGAVLRSIAVRLRTARITSAVSVEAILLTTTQAITRTVGVTWSTATTTTMIPGFLAWDFTGDTVTDSDLDGASVGIACQLGDGDLRLYEAYVDVTYVTKHRPLGTAPTGTLTEDTTPEVTWTDSVSDPMDPDGGAQTHFEVKIFTAAQYMAADFDPDSSTPHETSGIVASSVQSYQVVNSLVDGAYRAYVRRAQTVNGQLHWSYLWNGTDFEVDTPPPADPTLSVTADNANARNVATITQGTSGLVSTDDYQLQRSYDAGTTWENVRTDAGGGLVPPQPKVVATSEFSSTADATTHTISYPAPDEGILEDDLLIAFAGFDGSPAITFPEGWVEIKDEAGNGSAVRAGCAYKRAGGGETGTFDITTSVSQGGGVRVLCIRGSDPATAPEDSTGVSAATANADPDSLNPTGWATENTLWIAAMVNDGNVAVTAGPSGFYGFGNTRWADANGAGVATAWQRDNVASKDPGAFTQTAEDTRAWTVAVRPAGLITQADYEAPNGTEADYRVRARHDFGDTFSFSAWVEDSDTWESTSWWLKHPTGPDLNYEAAFGEFTSFPGKSRAGRTATFQPLGATGVVVMSDTRGPETGQIVIRCDSDTDRENLDALLDEDDPYLLQGPDGEHEDDRWIVVTDHNRERVADKSWIAQTFETLSFTTVPRPD